MFPSLSTSIPVGVTMSGCSASKVSLTPGSSSSIWGGTSAGTSGALGGAVGGAATATAGMRASERRRFIVEWTV